MELTPETRDRIWAAQRALEDVQHRERYANTPAYRALTPAERDFVDRAWWANRFEGRAPDPLTDLAFDLAREVLGVEDGMGLALGFGRKVVRSQHGIRFESMETIDDVKELGWRVVDPSLPASARRLAVVAWSAVALLDRETRAVLGQATRDVPAGAPREFAEAVT